MSRAVSGPVSKEPSLEPRPRGRGSFFSSGPQNQGPGRPGSLKQRPRRAAAGVASELVFLAFLNRGAEQEGSAEGEEAQEREERDLLLVIGKGGDGEGGTHFFNLFSSLSPSPAPRG